MYEKRKKDLQIQTGNYDRTRDRKDLLRGLQLCRLEKIEKIIFLKLDTRGILWWKSILKF